MTLRMAVALASLLQDPEEILRARERLEEARQVLRELMQEEEPPLEDIPVPEAPAEKGGKGGPQEEAVICGGECHDGSRCASRNRICRQCRQAPVPCFAHAGICWKCARKQQICPFCQKPLPTSEQGQQEVAKRTIARRLPGHRIGRPITNPVVTTAFPRIRFYYVIHGAVPCTGCGRGREVLLALPLPEPAGEEGSPPGKLGEPVVIKSEAALLEILKTQKIEGGDGALERAALATAQVAALLIADPGPVRANGKPATADSVQLESKGEILRAIFEYGRGAEARRLTVTLERGSLSGLSADPITGEE